ncbi:MAG: hypothetical protein WAL83_04825, partial [Arenicellales bacterium]
VRPAIEGELQRFAAVDSPSFVQAIDLAHEHTSLSACGFRRFRRLFAGFVTAEEFIRHRMAHGIEPSTASVRMDPSLMMHAAWVFSEEDVVTPFVVGQLFRVLGPLDVRFPSVAEFGDIPFSTPWTRD